MKHVPKKSLGQHFLRSQSALAKIVAAADIQIGETVLEIGPGEGVLTAELLRAGANVIAVEKDDQLYRLLESREWKVEGGNRITTFHLPPSTFTPIHADILKLDHNSIGLKNGEYKVVANIPYYITGAILEMFLEHEPRPKQMTLLVQKEVAERIVARDKKESLLSVSVKAFGIPRIIDKVPRGAFVPVPTVDSAILNIENISDARFKDAGIDPLLFFKVVRAGFAHKRKFLMRNLESVVARERLEGIWREFGPDAKIRAEDFDLNQWFAVAKSIGQIVL